jgi:hypothetical protein
MSAPLSRLPPVPAPPKPPGQRLGHSPRESRRASSTALPETNRRKAPPPPSWLAKRLHPAYRQLWRGSVAGLWAPEAADLVARLVEDRDRLRRLGDDATAALRSAVLQLERGLLLEPKAARASGVTVRDEAPADVDAETTSTKRRRSSFDRARRERVLRAVT